MNRSSSVTAEIIHGDCLDVMRGMEAGSVDAIVTDPPFFAPATHYQSRVQWQRKWSDMSILEHWWGTICEELRRIQKPHGHTLAFCNADSYPAFYPAMYCRWDKIIALVWDKDRPGLGRVWRHQHEFVIAARNSGAWEANDGKLRRDVLRHKATLPSERCHPVEKPASLLAEIIEAVCPAGSVVFDPFAGGGSTGIGAVLTGRSFVGIERDEQYADLARKRIADAQAQLTLGAA